MHSFLVLGSQGARVLPLKYLFTEVMLFFGVDPGFFGLVWREALSLSGNIFECEADNTCLS